MNPKVHEIVYSCDSREELAERIVELEDENAKLKNNNNYLHEMLSESRQANEYLHVELKRYKSILRTRPNAMTALYDENEKLRELARDALMLTEDTDCYGCRYDEHADCEHGNECTLLRRASEFGIGVPQ